VSRCGVVPAATAFGVDGSGPTRAPTWFRPGRVSAVAWLARLVLFERGVEVESQRFVLAAQGIQLSSELFRGTFFAGHRGAFVELLVAHVSPRLAGRPIQTVRRRLAAPPARIIARSALRHLRSVAAPGRRRRAVDRCFRPARSWTPSRGSGVVGRSTRRRASVSRTKPAQAVVVSSAEPGWSDRGSRSVLPVTRLAGPARQRPRRVGLGGCPVPNGLTRVIGGRRTPNLALPRLGLAVAHQAFRE
jgi:hypothetical protein